MKIFIHSHPGYSYFFIEALKFANMVHPDWDIEWGVILYSNSGKVLDKFREFVKSENILYLQEKLNDYMAGTTLDLDELKNFPASIFECISTSKIHPGHIYFQKKPREYQLKIITGTYIIYKEFLLKRRPDFVFFPIIELYDSMILYHLCNELGIKRIIYAHARNLNVSYFTDSIDESLPSYAFKKDLSQEDVEKASDFIHAFRKEFKVPFEVEYQPTPDEILDTSYMRKGIFEKVLRFITTRLGMLGIPIVRNYVINEPHLVDRYTLIHKLRIHFYPLTVKYRKLKGWIDKRYYDLRNVSDLPQKFIYYPLQYTPEASINTPTPFFVDQLRVIDLILNSMPANLYLVVKEHPAMIGIRPLSFYRELKKRAGVLLADFSLPSIDVIKRALLTISVTGTSCLEAFLLGKPSLHIGKAFFSDWIWTFDSFSGFKKLILDAIKAHCVPEEKIIDFVGRTLRVGSDFVIYSGGGGPYGDSELLMNKSNINNFLKSLFQHINQLKQEVLELPKEDIL